MTPLPITREERERWREWRTIVGEESHPVVRLLDALDAADRMAEALDRCESNRGRFSCVDQHDLRCPKSRADSPDKWKGEWRCECGGDALDESVAAYRRLVEGATP